jgi:1,4-dihydroxy-6-naphthoate synthase
MQKIHVAHSPDSDDAFMFYALAKNKIDTGDLVFEHVLSDIETLNKKAEQKIYEVSAISIHNYPYVAENYILLPTGSSMGDRYGPMIVAAESISAAELENITVAVPGERTTALLAMRLFNPNIRYEFVPFDQIIPQILEGKYGAGLIIHEGQLTYAESGLKKVVDMGEWWYGETGLPLPLGGNVIRRDLGLPLMQHISRLLRESIQYSLDHREEAVEYALQYAGDMSQEQADKFVGMYVNHWTLDYGERGRKAVKTLLEKGFEHGIINIPVKVDFLED